VKSSALPEFWDCLEDLPPQVQKIARKNFKLWQKNPSLKSLDFKKSNPILRPVCAGFGFRALATFEDAATFGFGSARMTNTNVSSATSKLQFFKTVKVSAISRTTQSLRVRIPVSPDDRCFSG
jgi:hypothetical protein